jgi:hypothetical protein
VGLSTAIGSRLSLEIGLRVPAITDDVDTEARYGVLADFNRFEAFEKDAWTTRLMVRATQKLDNATSVEAFLGPSAVIADNHGVDISDIEGPDYYYYYFMPGGSYWEENDNQLLIDYGLQINTHSRYVRMAATIAGRYWSTGMNPRLAQRTVHQFGAAVEFGDWRIRPGATVRVPLDDGLYLAGGGLRFVYGVTLRVGLGDGE